MPAPIKPTCSVCSAHVRWCEDAWTCPACGSEWDQDHNVRYVAPADQPEWEAVKDPRDRRRVLYWRLIFQGKAAGSIARQYGGWRALGYSQTIPSPSGNIELGTHSQSTAAERAVLAHWEQAWVLPLRTKP